MTKHNSFEEWQQTVQARLSSPNEGTINNIMKAWASDRTHLMNINTEVNSKLDDANKTFEDLLNYAWGILYPGKTDWEYPGQVINHLWSEIKIQRKKVSDLNKIIREMMLSGNFLYDTVCDMHGGDWEMTKVWKLLTSKVEELLKVDQGKLPEPVIIAIDLALPGDVTALTQVLDKTSKEIATAFGMSEEQLSDDTQRKPATDNPELQ
ncbi:MAG: hypothetical protein WC479_00750 [Candidatus Izemoplasmatales bacterium]